MQQTSQATTISFHSLCELEHAQSSPIPLSENPFRVLLAQSKALSHSESEQTHHDPHLSHNNVPGLDTDSITASDVRALYAAHRTEHNAASRAQLLNPSIPLVTDPILTHVLAADPPDFARDVRHNLTVWARLPAEVVRLVGAVQERVRKFLGSGSEGSLEGIQVWLPPPDALHMTVFEIASGLSADALSPVVDALAPHATTLTDPYLPYLASAPSSSPPSSPSPPHIAPALDTPTLNFSRSGLSLSFLPALSDPSSDAPTILHLRAALWDAAARAGVQARARYALPSAHVTVARFVGREVDVRPCGKGKNRVEWVRLVDEINEELREWQAVWRLDKAPMVLRAGVSWYGGGVTVGGAQDR